METIVPRKFRNLVRDEAIYGRWQRCLQGTSLLLVLPLSAMEFTRSCH